MSNTQHKIEQLELLTDCGRELYAGPDYVTGQTPKFGDEFVIPATGERFGVSHAQPFRSGRNRRILLHTK